MNEQSRLEALLAALINGETSDIIPQSRVEKIRLNIVNGTHDETLVPGSRIEAYLQAISAKGLSGGFPNGTKWTKSNVLTNVTKLEYANGIWVACNTSGYVGYSTDGKTWTRANINPLNVKFLTCVRDIWYLGVASAVYYSKDGMSWTKIDSLTYGYYKPVYANGIFLIAGSAGEFYSTDGITWTVNERAGELTLNIKVYANGIWVGSNMYGTGVYYSTDGLTWTVSNITDMTFDYIINCNDMWFGCYTHQGIYYSKDGMTWTRCTLNGITNVDEITYANGIWIGSGYTSSAFVCYSEDGITWIKSGLEGYHSNLSYFKDMWIVGRPKYKYGASYSHDGKTWTDCVGLPGYVMRIIYANGMWLASLKNEDSLRDIYYSTDGINWSISDLINIDNAIGSIVNADGIWVAATDDGLYYSVTWEP